MDILLMHRLIRGTPDRTTTTRACSKNCPVLGVIGACLFLTTSSTQQGGLREVILDDFQWCYSSAELRGLSVTPD
jgi:hypothetical protein